MAHDLINQQQIIQKLNADKYRIVAEKELKTRSKSPMLKQKRTCNYTQANSSTSSFL